MYLDDALPIFQLDQDISRFEVTVPHIVGMNIFEDMQDLPKQQLHLIGCQLTSAPHHERSNRAACRKARGEVNLAFATDNCSYVKGQQVWQ